MFVFLVLKIVNCLFDFVMSENERFVCLLEYLIKNKVVRNQQQFTEEVNSDKATVSQIKNEKLKIPNNLFANIESAFPYISIDWLKNGEGKMLRSGNINKKNGNGNTSVAEDGNQVTMANISDMIDLQKGYQDILKTSQAQISALISIIEKMNDSQ